MITGVNWRGVGRLKMVFEFMQRGGCHAAAARSFAEWVKLVGRFGPCVFRSV
jgi:hypothetical protein